MLPTDARRNRVASGILGTAWRALVHRAAALLRSRRGPQPDRSNWIAELRAKEWGAQSSDQGHEPELAWVLPPEAEAFRLTVLRAPEAAGAMRVRLEPLTAAGVPVDRPLTLLVSGRSIETSLAVDVLNRFGDGSVLVTSPAELTGANPPEKG